MTVKQSLKTLKLQLMSPTSNPLLEPQEIKTKRRMVRTGLRQDLVNLQTGEIEAAATIHTIEERDDEEFVKVFADGIAAAYDLTRTGQRVFQLVLAEYQKTPMTGSYADSVELYWFGEGLSGQHSNISESTWNRGLRELLDKRFLWPRTPTSYWVNPALFFKGNRVVFIKEHRRNNEAKQPRKNAKKIANATNTLTDQQHRDALEARGQQRIDGA